MFNKHDLELQAFETILHGKRGLCMIWNIVLYSYMELTKRDFHLAPPVYEASVPPRPLHANVTYIKPRPHQALCDPILGQFTFERHLIVIMFYFW